VGVLNAAIGGGGVLGALAAAALLRRGRVATNFAAGLVLFGAPIVLVAAAPGTAATLFLLGVLGAGVAVVDFAAVTLLQRAIPDELLARVFSVLQSLFVATLGIGALVAPLLVSGLGIRGALLASGVVLPILAAALWRPLIGIDAGYVGPEAALEMLRATTIFAPLDLPTLERLARAMALRDVPAGTTVMRQGDPGDLYYLVAEGELRVDIDGSTVNNLATGDGFGEIALLRDIPRTASVVALTDVRLWSLDRETFVDAVSGSPSSRRAADALIDTRLAGLRADLATV
jgi:MFS family permease